MIKTTAAIEGMHCSMCETHINDAIRKAFHVKKVKSSAKKRTTEIVSQEPIDEKELSDVIRETGYDLKSVTSEPYKRKGLFGF